MKNVQIRIIISFGARQTIQQILLTTHTLLSGETVGQIAKLKVLVLWTVSRANSILLTVHEVDDFDYLADKNRGRVANIRPSLKSEVDIAALFLQIQRTKTLFIASKNNNKIAGKLDC